MVAAIRQEADAAASQEAQAYIEQAQQIEQQVQQQAEATVLRRSIRSCGGSSLHNRDEQAARIPSVAQAQAEINQQEQQLARQNPALQQQFAQEAAVAQHQEKADPQDATQIENRLFEQETEQVAPVDPQLAQAMEDEALAGQPTFGIEPQPQQVTHQPTPPQQQHG